MSMFSRNMEAPVTQAPKSPDLGFELTEQQQAIKERIRGTSFNIIARAGCSKTSVMEVAVPYLCEVEPYDEILVCSFSNAITDDIKKKLNALGYRNVKVSTIHSDAMETLRKLKVTYRLSKYKGTEVAEAVLAYFNGIPQKSKFAAITQAAKACSMHKLTTDYLS